MLILTINYTIDFAIFQLFSAVFFAKVTFSEYNGTNNLYKEVLMNLEGLTLKLVNDHLKEELLGGKIYRVFMPTPHSLLLMIKRDRDTTALLAELNGAVRRCIFLSSCLKIQMFPLPFVCCYVSI